MTSSNGSTTASTTQKIAPKINFMPSCPIPISDYPNVLLAHGSGGKLMHNMLEKLVLPAFDNTLLEARHDGAVFPVGNARLAFTTDSYVVRRL